ncbi:MAG: gliding motility-associated-like protein [Flavobacteriales bacterium]|jgi:gliding motility-associated-like protein
MKHLITLLSFISFAFGAYASHVPGGNITYQCVGPNQYEITLTLYEDCGSAFTSNANQTIQIANDCGITGLTTQSLTNTIFQQEVSQLCLGQIGNSECNGGTLPGVYMHQWTGIITIPADCDAWTFSYSSCCRNISTNATSSSANYYWESVLNSTTAPCNNSPVITAQPIPYNCVNQQVNYNIGAYEPDGNTLVYSLIPAMTNGTGGAITYGGGFSGASPIPGIVLDPNTGTITFTPSVVGNYIVAILIEEFDVNGNLVGSIIQDFQFEVINCAGNNNPTPPPGGLSSISGSGISTGPNDLQMCNGDNICVDVVFMDDATDSVYLTSNVLQHFPNATFTQTSWIGGIASATICFTVLPGSNPFSAITVNSMDNACPVVGVNAYTFGVTVISSTFAGVDETICLNNGVQLNANGGSNFNWSLVSGDPITPANFSCTNCGNPIANPSVTSVYEVTSNLAGGCTNTDQITVNVVPDFNYSLTQSSTTSCLNSDIQLDITPMPAGAYNYAWTGTDMNSTTIANPTITPTSPGIYDYTVIITSPQGCIKYDTISINVAAAYAPTVTVTTNLTSILCGDTIYFDTDLGGGVPATCGPSASTACSAAASQQTVGNPTGANSTTSWPAPFGNWYKNAKHQFLYTAAELQGMGFVGGKITELSFEVTTINGTANYNDYQISMGCTGTTALTTAAWETGLTQVFGPQNIFITTGWNTMVLTTAYEWDGISNLVVEVCYNNLLSPYTQNSVTPWTTTAFNSSSYMYSDGTAACPSPSPNIVSMNRPVTRFTTCPTIPDPNNYSFEWTPVAPMSDATAQNPFALPVTTTDFQLVVTDINGGCTDTVLTHIDVLCDTCQAPIPTITNATCFGFSDGEIVAAPYGQNGPPFDVQLLDPVTLAIIAQDPAVVTTTTFSNLTAGSYILRSYDTTGCWADTLVFVGSPPAMTLVVSTDTIVCIGGVGSISATAGGGNSTTYTYNWGQGLTGTTANQNVTPLSPTGYDIYALDSLGCTTDTLIVTVNMFPPILLTASAPDTVCPGETGIVSVVANGGYGGTYYYNWTDEFGNFIGNSNPQPVTPTTGPTKYYVLVTDNCSTPVAIDSVMVEWFDVPQPLIAADVQTGCYPVDVTFTNMTDPTLSDQCYWDFGNGNISTVCGPNFNSYGIPGSYDVQLTVTSINGCVGDTTYVGFIESYDYPTANFLITPDPIDVLNPTTMVTNLSSQDVTSFQYTFLDSAATVLGTSNLPSTEWTFPDAVPTFFDVELIVTNQWGCTDTAYNQVIMNGVYNFYVPSAFTPNGDGVNDIFEPRGEGVDELDYEMYIFDRWGVKLFETTATQKGWDGSHMSTPASMDVYVWKIYTKDKYTGEEHENIGHIMLIR